MDDLIGILFVLVSAAIIVDFGRAGLLLIRLGGNKRPFIGGLGFMLLTTPLVVSFFMGLIVANSIVEVPTVVAFGLYAFMVMVAIVGRRHWWKHIVEPTTTEKGDSN